MDRFVQAANVGRDRGRESPIPVPPASATLTGRAAASNMLCTPIRWQAGPKMAPKIPYWPSRDPVAPAMTPTMTANTPPTTAVTPNARAVPLRDQTYVASRALT